ncbi:MAG: hypothetical protein GWP08_06540 [Nitrospiraceae bacterium]|nr:hypothetical protein [Nitrospiraceae bacterium]
MTFDKSEKKRPRPSLDMTPLIDVVFQLILFFMLSSTFVVQSSINIETAEAKGAVAFEQKDISITLVYDENAPEGRGPLYVNEVRVKDMGELTQVLSEAHAERPETQVLVRPDKRIPSARLIEVLGIANSVGFQRCGIAARPPAEE